MNKKRQKRWYISLAYVLVAVIWISAVIYASFFVPALEDQNADVFSHPRQMIFRFGFNQLCTAKPGAVILFIAIIALIAARMDEVEKANKFISGLLPNRSLPVWLARLLITAMCTILLWVFRSQYENQDFWSFKDLFPDAMARGLLVVRFDEMWESFLHFEAYRFFTEFLGLNINQSFQILSVLAGSVFVYFALVLSGALNPQKPYQIFLIVISGGFIQLFFGDMENYTLCGLLIFLYIVSSYYFLKSKISLLIPTAILAAAVTFHMEAVFLIPSLVFLVIVQVNKRDYSPIYLSALLFIGWISWTLLFFLSRGASLQALLEASWGLGRGGSAFANLVSFSPPYFWGQINLLGLIYPPIWFVLPLLISGGIKKNVFNAYLVIASICGFIFFFLWSSSIGLYMDWNLFALPLLPAIILFAYNVTQQDFPLKKQVVFIIIAFAYLLTYSWIGSNHFLV